MTFRLLPGPLDKHLAVRKGKNIDTDTAHESVNIGEDTTDSRAIKQHDRGRQKREEPAEQSGRTNKVSILVPPQILTETEEQRSVAVYRIKPLPEIAFCGWTHHQMKGEVIWDPKGCDLTITKEEDEWVLTMNTIEPIEGE